MNAQPLLVLGDRRREALLARTADAARRWRQSWLPQSTDTFECSCEPPAATMPASMAASVASVATSCWALEVSGERIAVLSLPHSTFHGCVQQSGAATSDIASQPAADSLVEKLEREVAQTLLIEISGLERRDVVNVARVTAEAVADFRRAARAWSFNVRAAAGRGFTVWLAAARVERLSPARAPSSVSLESRRDAIGRDAVGLRAVVGHASMSVSELAELALDDVLVLEQHLSEPVTLVSPVTGIPVAAGHLGRSGARRAVKVAAISPHKN